MDGESHQIRDFARRYAGHFDAFLENGTEETLRAAYELGREAIRRELSVLDVAAVHHEAVGRALRSDRDLEPHLAVALGGQFFSETLSAFEMVQRGYREERQRALLEQQQAKMLRQLSTLLSDAALTAGVGESFAEVLQLVAEQARELTAADGSVARTRVPGGRKQVEAAAHAEGAETWSEADVPRTPAPAAAAHHLEVPILALDGSGIGELGVSRLAGPFTELDKAILVHVAQLTAAALERAGLYHNPK